MDDSASTDDVAARVSGGAVQVDSQFVEVSSSANRVAQVSADSALLDINLSGLNDGGNALEVISNGTGSATVESTTGGSIDIAVAGPGDLLVRTLGSGNAQAGIQSANALDIAVSEIEVNSITGVAQLQSDFDLDLDVTDFLIINERCGSGAGVPARRRSSMAAVAQALGRSTRQGRHFFYGRRCAAECGRGQYADDHNHRRLWRHEQ